MESQKITKEVMMLKFKFKFLGLKNLYIKVMCP